MRTSTLKAWPREPKVQAIVEPLSVEIVQENIDVVQPVKSVFQDVRKELASAAVGNTEPRNVLFTIEFTPERLWISLLLLVVLFLSYKLSVITYQLEKMLRT